MSGIEYISIWALSTPLWVIKREKAASSKRRYLPRNEQNPRQIRELLKRGPMSRDDICGMLAHCTGVRETIAKMLVRGHLIRVGGMVALGKPPCK